MQTAVPNRVASSRGDPGVPRMLLPSRLAGVAVTGKGVTGGNVLSLLPAHGL